MVCDWTEGAAQEIKDEGCNDPHKCLTSEPEAQEFSEWSIKARI